jgi:CubicO group peptidase (beta-lactamase class C family)
VDRPPLDRAALDRALAYVDSWLSWRVPRTDVPGVTAAVALGGEVLFAGGYGLADVEAGRPMEADDVFRIASHSKTFAATAVLQLVEAGRIGLDDPVSRHLDWLAAHPDPRVASVSIRQLLCHGAGIIRDGLDSDFWQLRRPFPDAGQLRSEVLAAELVTDPNVAMKYSNFGFGLLGAVVESAGGAPFGAYVAEQLTGPLGLTATVAEPAADTAVVTGYGSRRTGGGRRALPPVDTRALAAATGFAGTAPELCRWMSAHLVGSGLLLADATKREMQRVHWHAEGLPGGAQVDYGLGLILEKLGERHTFGHSGGFPGHITRTFADPADSLVVSVLTNCIDGPASEIAKGILGIIDAVCAPGDADQRALALDGRYESLWGASDVVTTGAGMLVGEPASWAPLADADRLEVVDDTTLRISRTSSFGSAGELVRFTVTDGEVRQVSWAGRTQWPEDRWDAAEAELLGP